MPAAPGAEPMHRLLPPLLPIMMDKIMARLSTLLSRKELAILLSPLQQLREENDADDCMKSYAA